MLQLTQIAKSFGGVHALQDVSLDVRAGEIHALLGENGAGKSTLMKVISGAHQADRGTLEFDGQEVTQNNPSLAKALGISIIYQEFSLVPALTVSENIFLGSPEARGWLHIQAMHAQASAVIESLGFDIDVRKTVSELSVAQQQVVEIAKALSLDVKLLILDEPSAVLGPAEIKQLFAVLRKLRDNGVAIIYISHHLEELLALTDRITVLKDGRTISTVETKTVDKDGLVHLMVGRALSQLYPEKPLRRPHEGELTLHNIRVPGAGEPLSLTVRKGEILGIGGLVGAGRTEVLEDAFGLTGNPNVSRQLEGETLAFSSPRNAVKQGWGMVPEDRKRLGGMLNQSIRDNISLANLKHAANRWGFIDRRKEEAMVNGLVDKLQIKLEHIHRSMSTLSGGNQQKVVLAKWLNQQLNVLLIDEPTRGVDVGARAEIYHIIQDLANQGIYVIMVSSDMEELMGMADCILVMRNGAIQGTVERTDFSEEKILRLAIGAD